MNRTVRMLALASALSPLVVTGVADASSRCAKPGSHTVALSERARIYSVSGARVPTGRDTYACLFRSGRHVRIARRVDRVLASFHLAGRYVGFVSTGADRSYSTVHSVDLRTGAAVVRAARPGYSITDLEIGPSGSLAWIRRRETLAPEPDETAVEKVDVNRGAGAAELVDPGPGIDKNSLSSAKPLLHFPPLGSLRPAESDTIYWWRSGEPRSAAFETGSPTRGTAIRYFPGCRKREARVIAANRTTALYIVGSGDAGSAYACDLRTKTRYPLGSAVFDARGIGPFDLNRNLIVFETRACIGRNDTPPDGRPGCRIRIKVFHVGRGRTIRDIPTQSNGTTDVVAAPSGAVAWIARQDVNPDYSRPDYEVKLARAGGAPITLMRSGDVDPGSLGLSRSVVYWTSGGRPMSAALR